MSLFASKENQMIGIDLSTTSVKMVELQSRQGIYHLKTYGIESLEQEQVIDKSMVNSEAIGNVIASLVKRCRIGIKKAATAISGSLVITKLIDMDAKLTEGERDTQIRLDADQYIPYPLSEINLDFEILGPSLIDDSMVQVLLVASRSENVEQRVDALTFGGLETKVIDIESHAIERTFQLMIDSLPSQTETIALFDIGHTQTTLNIVKNGEFIYNREQLFGGDQLTEAIQTRYGLTFEEATINKRNQTLPNDYESEVLIPFIENLIQQIIRSLQFYFAYSKSANVNHILLCGGSASLPGLVDLIEQKIGSNVSIANPFINMTIDSGIDTEQLVLDAPSLMVACGLALRSFD